MLKFYLFVQDLPADTEKPRKVLFVDFGQSQTQACIAEFQKAKLVVSSMFLLNYYY